VHWNQFKRFIKTVKQGSSFIFDEHGLVDYEDDTINVLLESKNHSFSKQQGINYYRFTLVVREV